MTSNLQTKSDSLACIDSSWSPLCSAVIHTLGLDSLYDIDSSTPSCFLDRHISMNEFDFSPPLSEDEIILIATLDESELIARFLECDDGYFSISYSLVSIVAREASHTYRRARSRWLASVRSGMLDYLSAHELWISSSLLLLANAENYSAWNSRKDILTSDRRLASVDLEFCHFLLKKHPKSPEAFEHRRWILVHALSEMSVERIEMELAIADEAAARHKKNYYAWSHKGWLIKFMSPCLISSQIEEVSHSVLSSAGDHSSFHYLELLLQVADMNSKNLEHFVHDLKTAIHKNPGHEAMWCHLRFLLCSLFTSVGVKERNDKIVEPAGSIHNLGDIIATFRSFCKDTAARKIETVMGHDWMFALLSSVWFEVWLRKQPLHLSCENDEFHNLLSTLESCDPLLRLAWAGATHIDLFLEK